MPDSFPFVASQSRPARDMHHIPASVSLKWPARPAGVIGAGEFRLSGEDFVEIERALEPKKIAATSWAKPLRGPPRQR
jgi:hypothetical protein